MKLRKLQLKDAKWMLEWMHDEQVVRYLNADFASKTMEDCERFIQNSEHSEQDLHLAIADEQDEYMGTVSLKHIDRESGMAEFAITIRSEAMGKGISAFGMKEMLRIGFEKLHLKQIIWCVSKDNERAVRFYDKQKFSRVTDIPQMYKNYYSEQMLDTFIWYGVTRGENI